MTKSQYKRRRERRAVKEIENRTAAYFALMCSSGDGAYGSTLCQMARGVLTPVK